MSRKVLIAVDGSNNSEKAFQCKCFVIYSKCVTRGIERHVWSSTRTIEYITSLSVRSNGPKLSNLGHQPCKIHRYVISALSVYLFYFHPRLGCLRLFFRMNRWAYVAVGPVPTISKFSMPNTDWVDASHLHYDGFKLRKPLHIAL